MTVKLGLSIHERELRAVLVAHGAIVWSGASSIADGESLGDAIERTLITIPRRRWGAPNVSVAVGLCWSEVKQLDGLPPADDLRVLTQVLRENGAAFFLRSGGRLAITDVTRGADETLWAAAFDHGILEQVVSSLRARGLTNVRFLPAAHCLSLLLERGTHCYREGEHAVELTIGDDVGTTGVKRTRTSAQSDVRLRPAAFVALGAEGRLNAAAYGAAVASKRSAFVWRPPPDARRVSHLAQLRISVALLLVACATIAAVASPGLRAHAFVSHAAGERLWLRDVAREGAATQSDIRRVSSSLDRLQKFDARRGATTVLLGALAAALPDSTALVTMRVDSLEGSIVLLAPHATDVLSELVAVDGIVAPRIVGSVTRETMGSAHLERATIRFRRRRQAR